MFRHYLGSHYWQLFKSHRSLPGVLHAYHTSDDGVRDVVLLATPGHLSACMLTGRLDCHCFRRHQSSFYNTDAFPGLRANACQISDLNVRWNNVNEKIFHYNRWESVKCCIKRSGMHGFGTLSCLSNISENFEIFEKKLKILEKLETV